MMRRWKEGEVRSIAKLLRDSALISVSLDGMLWLTVFLQPVCAILLYTLLLRYSILLHSLVSTTILSGTLPPAFSTRSQNKDRG